MHSTFVMEYMYIIAMGQNQYDPWVHELSKPCSCQWDNITHRISSKNKLYLWSTDPKINWGHLLVMTNLHTKYEDHQSKHCLVIERKWHGLRTDGPTDMGKAIYSTPRGYRVLAHSDVIRKFVSLHIECHQILFPPLKWKWKCCFLWIWIEIVIFFFISNKFCHW
jgi:hypothetical protein